MSRLPASPVEQLRVTARPVDTYSGAAVDRTAGADGLQVAHALTSIVPSLRAAGAANMQGQRIDADLARERGFNLSQENPRKSFRDAVREGQIEEWENPYLREGYEKSYAATISHDFEIEARNAFMQSDVANSDDIGEVQKFFTDYSEQYRQASDAPAFREVFNANANQAVLRMTSSAQQRIGQRLVARSQEQTANRIGDIMEEHEGSDYSTLTAQLQAYSTEQYENGVDGSFIRSAVVKQVAQRAVQIGDKDYFKEVLSRMKGGTGSLYNTAEARELVNTVEVRAERVRQEADLKTKVVEIGGLMTDITLGQADPDEIIALSQDLPDIYDPQWAATNIARNRVNGIRTAMSGVSSAEARKTAEAAALNHVTDALIPALSNVQKGADGKLYRGTSPAGLEDSYTIPVPLANGESMDITIKTSDAIQHFLDGAAERAAEKYPDDALAQQREVLAVYANYGHKNQKWSEQLEASVVASSGSVLNAYADLEDGNKAAILSPVFREGFDLARLMIGDGNEAYLKSLVGEDKAELLTQAVRNVEARVAESPEQAMLYALKTATDRKTQAAYVKTLNDNADRIEDAADDLIGGKLDASYWPFYAAFDDKATVQQWISDRTRQLLPAQRGNFDRALDMAIKDGQKYLVNMNGYLLDTQGLPVSDRADEALARLVKVRSEALGEDPSGVIAIPHPANPDVFELRDRDSFLPIGGGNPAAYINVHQIASEESLVREEVAKEAVDRQQFWQKKRDRDRGRRSANRNRD